MNKYWRHFKMITKHKYYVFKACCKAGIPIRGLLHDLSKYSPVEFIEYSKYYTGTHSPVEECKKQNGYCKAWQHHKGHNPHHWIYWVDNIEEGGIGTVMPYKYTIEMICDFIGAGQIYEKDSWDFNRPYDWFISRTLERKKIHPNIVEFVDYILLEIKETKSYAPLNKRHTKICYELIVGKHY